VAADPDVLVLVGHEVGQRLDDLLAVAHQDVAGASLEMPVVEQADQRRDEDEVRGAGLNSRRSW
jgi:hypothetical protein